MLNYIEISRVCVVKWRPQVCLIKINDIEFNYPRKMIFDEKQCTLRLAYSDNFMIKLKGKHKPILFTTVILSILSTKSS